MKKTAILLGSLVFILALSLSNLTAQEIGDNATIIVPPGKLTLHRQIMNVKGAPKAAKKVGNCGSGSAQFQDVEIVDRAPTPGTRGAEASTDLTPTVTTEAAIIFPGVAGFKELKPGWQLGSWREGGKCGPGYEAFVGYIIAKQ